MHLNNRFDFKFQHFNENAIDVLKDWEHFCSDTTGYLILRRAVNMALEIMEQHKEQPQLYTHYRGNEYEIIHKGKDTESGEEIIVYRDVKPPYEVYIRTLKTWEEIIDHNGVKIPRFGKKEESNE